ncbi:MAG: type VI secretion system tip protein VgrG [Candidatus Competibacteraceae bacterium]|nr:type VI secretion system tip protein VgrG [Candidatus Competibacteraceae bacterium]MBK9951771.1 type VI secretion system tip protein VgrG [Candidatus Competibacteraceae bacterium]
MATTQKYRMIAVNSVLGEDVLLFGRMTFTEQLGQLFAGHLELFSEKTDIKLADVLGTNMTVRLALPYQQGTRYFNGFVTRFSYEGTRGLRYGVYRAELNSWLWFLTRTSDCRIFQNKTVPDIIKEVFRGHGFTDFKDKLSGSYRQWEYCVQYRETDFNFVSRLMQQEGIYYYFEHENGKNSLVLADGVGSHGGFPKYESVPFFPPDAHDRRERDALSEWLIDQSVQPGAYFLNDYDFTAPRKSLRAVLNQPKAHAQSGFEMYDYPGEYTELGDGNSYSKIRLEELLAQQEVARGRGNAAGLAAGYLFSLSNCPRDDQNRKYLIVSATHHLESDEYESFSGYGISGKPYQGEITAIDAQQQYRAPRITPKPVVQGPQTAVVVGPAGEEIYTDQYGRVKCQFHWDRYGKADENSSCWIRVAQGWAGKKWGTVYLPRIGHEVIVEFLEGDPDQPIITGRVYNGINMPPYALPDNKTLSTLKSLSSKGGGGFNEFRFEDKKGEEQIFLHAERNEDIRVKKDALEWIGEERHLIVKKKQFEQVEGEKHLIVKSGAGGKGDQFEQVAGEKHQEVKQDWNQKVGGSLSLKVGMDRQEKVGLRHALDAGMEIHLKAGMKVVIEAGVQLTLKAGASFVDISPAGVVISGAPLVLINSGGAAGSGSGSSPTAPTAPTAPKEAANDQPGQITDTQAAPLQKKSQSLDSVSVSDLQTPQAKALAAAAKNGTPFCEICEAAKRGGA